MQRKRSRKCANCCHQASPQERVAVEEDEGLAGALLLVVDVRFAYFDPGHAPASRVELRPNPTPVYKPRDEAQRGLPAYHSLPMPPRAPKNPEGQLRPVIIALSMSSFVAMPCFDDGAASRRGRAEDAVQQEAVGARGVLHHRDDLAAGLAELTHGVDGLLGRFAACR